MKHYKDAIEKDKESIVNDASLKKPEDKNIIGDIESHPILSEFLNNLGCSYKGHKKTENLI